jgi:DegV family protein with EDD domain
MKERIIMAVKVLTDSTSYINEDTLKELDIKIISLNIVFDTKSIMETDIDNLTFYNMMDKKGIPTSSQPSPGDMYNAMLSVVENGDELICIFLSSKMSGTYDSAHIAKDMILEKYSEARIEIVDSQSNCMQLGFAAVVAARAAIEGRSLEETKEEVHNVINRSRFLFIPNNLEYLRKGGRIGGASALIGSIFKIVPILTVEDGETTVLTKVRTQRHAIDIMLDKIKMDNRNFTLCEVVIQHINCYNLALDLAKDLKEQLNMEVGISAIGPVIGVHVGPGAIGIAYYCRKAIR